MGLSAPGGCANVVLLCPRPQESRCDRLDVERGIVVLPVSRFVFSQVLFVVAIRKMLKIPSW